MYMQVAQQIMKEGDGIIWDDQKNQQENKYINLHIKVSKIVCKDGTIKKRVI